MKVLVDQNLPHRLVDTFSEWLWVSLAEHVADRGWSSTDDRIIWTAMSTEPSLIVTKDKDFGVLSATLGFPPKVVLLRFGNCSVDALVRQVAAAASGIASFAADATKGLLIVDPAS